MSVDETAFKEIQEEVIPNIGDANIPMVNRFRKRLASDRSRGRSCSTSKGSGIYILARLSGGGEIES
jgi:hypothetical protein